MDTHITKYFKSSKGTKTVPRYKPQPQHESGKEEIIIIDDSDSDSEIDDDGDITEDDYYEQQNDPVEFLLSEKNTMKNKLSQDTYKRFWYRASTRSSAKHHLKGITKFIRETFYPDYEDVKKKKYSNSSMSVGSRVHRQLYHMVECVGRHNGKCDCETKTNTKRLSKMTRQALEKCEELEIDLVASEVMVGWLDAKLATRLDLIGYRWRGTDQQRSVLISIKTGYTSGYNVNRHGQKMQPPFEDLISCPRNHNQIQSVLEQMILEQEYHLKFDEYIIMYLGQGQNGNEAKIEYLDSWCTEKIRHNALLETVLKKAK